MLHPLALCSLYSWTIGDCRETSCSSTLVLILALRICHTHTCPLLTAYSLCPQIWAQGFTMFIQTSSQHHPSLSALGLIHYFTVKAEVLRPDLCHLPVSFHPLPYLNPHASFLLCNLQRTRSPFSCLESLHSASPFGQLLTPLLKHFRGHSF